MTSCPVCDGLPLESARPTLTSPGTTLPIPLVHVTAAELACRANVNPRDEHTEPKLPEGWKTIINRD